MPGGPSSSSRWIRNHRRARVQPPRPTCALRGSSRGCKRRRAVSVFFFFFLELFPICGINGDVGVGAVADLLHRRGGWKPCSAKTRRRLEEASADTEDMKRWFQIGFEVLVGSRCPGVRRRPVRALRRPDAAQLAQQEKAETMVAVTLPGRDGRIIAGLTEPCVDGPQRPPAPPARAPPSRPAAASRARALEREAEHHHSPTNGYDGPITRKEVEPTSRIPGSVVKMPSQIEGRHHSRCAARISSPTISEHAART